MTSREIIIDLIDKQIINGQDAFTLINDLLKAEMLEAWETLNASKQSGRSSLTNDDFNKIWVQTSSPYAAGYSSASTLTTTSGTNLSNV